MPFVLENAEGKYELLTGFRAIRARELLKLKAGDRIACHQLFDTLQISGWKLRRLLSL